MAIEFKRYDDDSLRIELAPLIDVIFQLLIFFMLSSTFLSPSLNIKLPKIEQIGDIDSLQELIISISKTGEYFINNDRIDPDNFTVELQRKLAHHNPKKVFFRADRSTPYQQIVDIMKAANAAGAQQFNFIYQDNSVSTQ